jgi:autotransporter-associated beta strand protein
LTISTALATTASYNGVIKDGTKKVSLIKSGTGSQAFVGVNSYTGNTTVSDGTLSLGNGTANTALADASDVIIGASAILNLNFSAANSDTVNKLTIGGVQKGVGVWGTTASGAANIDDTHFSGTGTLTVTSAATAGFLSWIDTPAFGLTAGQKGESADPDSDGIANLLEFVLNGNPSLSDPSILPVLNVTASNFEFTFNRRDDSVSPETTQIFQYGTNLTTWTSIVIPATSGSIGAATITVTDGTPADSVKISIPKATVAPETKLFGRLQVIK